MKAFFFIVLYKPLYNLLIFFAWLVPGHSMGWAIIAMTLLIRIALLPSSLKAAHLQVKSAKLQPKINKLKAEIKDQKEQSKALMDLYKEEGVSPLGSCLPLLIQLPIIFVLYYVFNHGMAQLNPQDLYHFVPQVNFSSHFLGLNLVKVDPWITPILAGLLQMVLSWLMIPKVDPNDQYAKKDPMMAMNKQMMFLLPLSTIYIGHRIVSGLVLYWIVTTVFSIVQQLYVNKNIRNEAAVAVAKIEKRPVEEMLALEDGSDSNESELEESDLIKPKSENKKQDFMTKMMAKRLDKQEKKAGVNVVVRTKNRK